MNWSSHKYFVEHKRGKAKYRVQLLQLKPATLKCFANLGNETQIGFKDET